MSLFFFFLRVRYTHFGLKLVHISGCIELQIYNLAMVIVHHHYSRVNDFLILFISLLNKSIFLRPTLPICLLPTTKPPLAQPQPPTKAIPPKY